MKIQLAPLLLTLTYIAHLAMGDTHFVSASSSTPSAPYTTWSSASASIEGAMGAASPGDEIWIARGIYFPTNQQDGFALKDEVGMFGGFVGGEASMSERDPETHLTILSGDMDRNDLTNSSGYVTSALSTNSLKGMNSYHVLSWRSSAGATNRIDGFVITAGHGREDDQNAPPSDLLGGGIYATGMGELHLYNCLIAGNRSGWGEYGGNGGGMFSYGDLVVSNCQIRGNASGAGVLDGGSGGGIYASRYLLISASTVASNSTGDGASFEGHGGSGGGFCVRGGGLLTGCHIVDNSTGSCTNSRGSGGSGGGGLSAGTLVVQDSVFLGNRCGAGGEDGGLGGGLLSEGPLTLVNSVFQENHAGGATNFFDSNGGAGGGIMSADTVILSGCSVVSNRAGVGTATGGRGGGVECAHGLLSVSNSLISGNSAGAGKEGGRGGGLQASGNGLVVASVISGNRAGNGCAEMESGCGGGIYAYGALEVRNSLIASNGAGNGDGDSDYGGSGGGIFSSGAGHLALIGSTVIANSGGTNTDNGHGGGVLIDGNADIINTILSGNTVDTGSFGPDLCRSGAGTVNVYYAVVADPATNSISGTQVALFDWSVESIGFVDAGVGNYQLKYGSPCIDAGSNELSVGNADLSGGPRIRGGRVDIGALEYDVATADSNQDGVPDSWYASYGLSPTNLAIGTQDTDMDAFDNRSEWVADTDPTNELSFLRIAAASNAVSSSLYFHASADRCYTLLYRTNLMSGMWISVPGLTRVPGSDGWTWFGDTNVTDTTRYYRLQVELP